MNDWMTVRELEIFAYVRGQAHDVDILDGLILAYLIVETYGFGSNPIYIITGIQALCSTVGCVSSSGF